MPPELCSLVNLERLGKTEEAIRDYSRVITLNGASPDQIGMALVARGITLEKNENRQRP